MKKDFQLKGLALIVRNLNKELEKIEGRSLNGMIQALAYVRTDMEHTSPKIPVDLGNLRQSAFILTHKSTNNEAQRSGNFKGDDATRMQTDHGSAISMTKSVLHTYRNPTAAIGFSANYAVYVHENIGGTVKWNRRGSGPKFLQAAMRRNKTQILKIVGENTRI